MYVYSKYFYAGLRFEIISVMTSSPRTATVDVVAPMTTPLLLTTEHSTDIGPVSLKESDTPLVLVLKSVLIRDSESELELLDFHVRANGDSSGVEQLKVVTELTVVNVVEGLTVTTEKNEIIMNNN